jgi:uncharacterized protein YbjT (DUF2867 family)
MSQHHIFVTGGTGYVGCRLLPELIRHGHRVSALSRPGSQRRLCPGTEPKLGDALDKSSFGAQIPPADTFIQLVGVPHPSPAKAKQFREIDLVSITASVAAAAEAGIQHFIYVSVAHPAPVMKAYIEVRSQGERMIESSGLNATILRPWYVLGPGHRWPYLLLPFYWIFERLPTTRASAQRLGLITIEQMVRALVWAASHPVEGLRILEVPEIREVKISPPLPHKVQARTV